MNGSTPVGGTPAFMDLRKPGGEVDAPQALRAFDAYFIGQLLTRATNFEEEAEGIFDGGRAGRMYRDFFYQEIARIVAENAGFGLAGEFAQQLGNPTGETAIEEGGK